LINIQRNKFKDSLKGLTLSKNAHIIDFFGTFWHFLDMDKKKLIFFVVIDGISSRDCHVASHTSHASSCHRNRDDSSSSCPEEEGSSPGSLHT